MTKQSEAGAEREPKGRIEKDLGRLCADLLCSNVYRGRFRSRLFGGRLLFSLFCRRRVGNEGQQEGSSVGSPKGEIAVLISLLRRRRSGYRRRVALCGLYEEMDYIWRWIVSVLVTL